jgi:hypothetical protein
MREPFPLRRREKEKESQRASLPEKGPLHSLFSNKGSKLY